MRSTILALCRGRYFTAERLGSLLHRNPNHLRDRYLTTMVKEGLLVQRFPAAASRPNQAYTAPSAEHRS